MQDELTENNYYRKRVGIPLLSHHQNLLPSEAGVLLDRLKKQKIEYILWEKPAVVPEVNFTLAYTKEALFVKFSVTEPTNKPFYTNINDPVYRDSCLELFIAIGSDEAYYNLEFNASGTCLGQIGTNRDNREFIPPVVLERISNYKEKQESDGDMHTWQLTLKIPFTVFIRHISTPIVNQPVRLNFFKCGDDLPSRHYMAWNEVKCSKPNFHLVEYFGEGTFEPYVI